RRRRRVLAGRAQPEQRPTRLEALDLDGRALACLPRGPGHAVLRGLPGHALRCKPAKAVGLVAESARDRVRRRVVEEGLGLGQLRAEVVEGEGQDRATHLLADPLALEAAGDP